jgi:hypothetical protein
MKRLGRSIAMWGILAAVLVLAIAGEASLAFGMNSRSVDDLRTAEKNRQALHALGPAAAPREALQNCEGEFEAALPQVAETDAEDPVAKAALAMELSAKLREGGMPAAGADAAARVAADSGELAGLVHAIGARDGVTIADLRAEPEGALVSLRLQSRIEVLPEVLAILAGLHSGGRIVTLSLRSGVAGSVEVGVLYGEGSGR